MCVIKMPFNVGSHKCPCKPPPFWLPGIPMRALPRRHSTQECYHVLQLRSLLSAQSRATEGFVFQGLDHIRDHAEVSLNDLSIACPCSGRPALKGALPANLQLAGMSWL